MRRADEGFAGSELHPAVDAQRRDDAGAAERHGHGARTVLDDPGRPGLRPELAKERQLLSPDYRGVTGRGDLVDAAGPPVIDVGAENRRPYVEPWMMEQEVPVGRLGDELDDLR